jgi:hypothetical protein
VTCAGGSAKPAPRAAITMARSVLKSPSSTVGPDTISARRGSWRVRRRSPLTWVATTSVPASRTASAPLPGSSGKDSADISWLGPSTRSTRYSVGSCSGSGPRRDFGMRGYCNVWKVRSGNASRRLANWSPLTSCNAITRSVRAASRAVIAAIRADSSGQRRATSSSQFWAWMRCNTFQVATVITKRDGSPPV